MDESATMPGWMGVVLTGCLLAQALVWPPIVGRLRRGEPIVARRRQTPVPWGADGALLAALFLVVGWGGVLASAAEETAPKQPIGLADAAAFTLVASLLATFGVAWIRGHYHVTRADFGLPRSSSEAVRDSRLGVAAMIAMLPLVYVVQVLLVWGLGMPSTHPTVQSLFAEPTFSVVAAALIMAVVVAPLIEEFAFRVLLQGWLEGVGGARAWWPIVISSAAFALAHAGQGWAPVPLFVFALGLGYVYRQTRSFVAVVAMHLAFNLLSVAMATAIGFQQAEPASPAPVPLPGATAMP